MVSEIRALTVRPPWSWAIAHGGKTVENRGWGTRYRGLLAIHGGALARWDTDGEHSPQLRMAWRDWVQTLPHPNVATPVPQRRSLHIDFGAVIAVATLAGCHLSPDFGGTCGATRPLCSPWAVRDSYHWLLEHLRPLAEPVPCRGMLGLWRLPPDAEKSVREQLGEDGT